MEVVVSRWITEPQFAHHFEFHIRGEEGKYPATLSGRLVELDRLWMQQIRSPVQLNACPPPPHPLTYNKSTPLMCTYTLL